MSELENENYANTYADGLTTLQRRMRNAKGAFNENYHNNERGMNMTDNPIYEGGSNDEQDDAGINDMCACDTIPLLTYVMVVCTPVACRSPPHTHTRARHALTNLL